MGTFKSKWNKYMSSFATRARFFFCAEPGQLLWKVEWKQESRALENQGQNPKGYTLCSKSKLFKTLLNGILPKLPCARWSRSRGKSVLVRTYRSPTPAMCSAPSPPQAWPGSQAGWKFTVFLCRVSLYLVQPWELAPCPDELGKGKTAAALTKLGFGFQGTVLFPSTRNAAALMALSSALPNLFCRENQKYQSVPWRVESISRVKWNLCEQILIGRCLSLGTDLLTEPFNKRRSNAIS